MLSNIYHILLKMVQKNPKAVEWLWDYMSGGI